MTTRRVGVLTTYGARLTPAPVDAAHPLTPVAMRLLLALLFAAPLAAQLPTPTASTRPTPVLAEPCAEALGMGQWLDAPQRGALDVERRDETRVVALDGTCRAVVTLRRTSDGDRYLVAWPPCTAGGAWRFHPTLYVQRASAATRAVTVPACPAR
jgi:hypothetical protein